MGRDCVPIPWGVSCTKPGVAVTGEGTGWDRQGLGGTMGHGAGSTLDVLPGRRRRCGRGVGVGDIDFGLRISTQSSVWHWV